MFCQRFANTYINILSTSMFSQHFVHAHINILPNPIKCPHFAHTHIDIVVKMLIKCGQNVDKIKILPMPTSTVCPTTSSKPAPSSPLTEQSVWKLLAQRRHPSLKSRHSSLSLPNFTPTTGYAIRESVVECGRPQRISRYCSGNGGCKLRSFSRVLHSFMCAACSRHLGNEDGRRTRAKNTHLKYLLWER